MLLPHINSTPNIPQREKSRGNYLLRGKLTLTGTTYICGPGGTGLTEKSIVLRRDFNLKEGKKSLRTLSSDLTARNKAGGRGQNGSRGA